MSQDLERLIPAFRPLARGAFAPTLKAMEGFSAQSISRLTTCSYRSGPKSGGIIPLLVFLGDNYFTFIRISCFTSSNFPSLFCVEDLLHPLASASAPVPELLHCVSRFRSTQRSSLSSPAILGTQSHSDSAESALAAAFTHFEEQSRSGQLRKEALPTNSFVFQSHDEAIDQPTVRFAESYS